MNKDQIAELALSGNYDLSININDIISASDFRVITEAPVRVEPNLESEHLRIHQDSACNAGIDNWGFSATIDKLSEIEGESVEFVAFKGAGFTVKMYLNLDRTLPIGLVVTRRLNPAPAIDATGKIESLGG